jgi:hypothetical protein
MGNLLKADNIDIVLGVSSIGFVPRAPEDFPAHAREKVMAYQARILSGESGRVHGLIERMDQHQKPVIITSVPSSSESGAIEELLKNNIFTYRAPEDGARVISYLVNYGRYLSHA